jgi:hypothetical protein
MTPPALQGHECFTVLLHHSAKGDLIGVSGMGLRLPVESVDVSNRVLR